MIKNKSKSIMIQGTGSHVGKSITVAAICRILKQDGYNVCPFKSQNMALNSYVTASGGEMGRAQVVQAEACGLEPEVYMNPILIKPVADSREQIIFMGKVVKNMNAIEYNEKKVFYLKKIREILNDLKKKFDYIVIEGAGSPAEINLIKNDIVNMRIAEIAGSNVILVGDVDKGGVFASFYGTVKLLPHRYRKYIKGLLVNKFRGDISLLKTGNDYISKKLTPLFKVCSRGNKSADFYDGFITSNGDDGSLVLGTYIHGIFDNYDVREFILHILKEKNNIILDNDDSEVLSYDSFKEKQYDGLANIFRGNMNMELFYNILDNKL